MGICSQSDETTYTTQNLFLVTSDFETGGHYKYKQSLGSNRPMSNITKALANVKYKSRTGEIRFASVQVAREVQAVNAAAVIGSLQRF